LRSELALARARLAAAREQTATFSLSPTRTASPIEKSEDNISEHNPEFSDRSSAGSVASTWAPPGMMALTDTVESVPHDLSAEAAEPSVHDLDLGTEELTAGGLDAESENPKIESKATKVSFWEKSLMKEESKMEEWKFAPETTGKPTPASPSRSTFSYAEKSLIDEVDEDEGETFPESSFEATYATGVGLQTPEIPRVDTGVDELRRQLQESSRRLDKANSRLNGLVDLPELQKANGFHAALYRGINRVTFLAFDEEEKVGGLMDEVVMSEDQSIEVKRIRYVDI
jgi:hypothetical protein